MEGTENIKEEQKVQPTEKQIFQLKSVVYKNNTLRLIEYIACILMALLFFLPLINVNLIIAEENLSLFDIIIAQPEVETVKGQLAYALGAEAFGISGEEYSIFLSMMNPVEYWDSQNIVGSVFSIIFLIFFWLGCSLFCIYLVSRAVFMIIPTCAGYNIERYIRYATPNTFEKLFIYKDRFFVVPTFVYEYEHKTSIRSMQRQCKTMTMELIAYTLFNLFAVFFPLTLTFKMMAVEGVKVNFLLPSLMIAFAICIVVCKIMQIIHSTKYQSTLHSCKSLRSLIRV